MDGVKMVVKDGGQDDGMCWDGGEGSYDNGEHCYLGDGEVE